MIRMGFYSRN